LEQKVNKIHAAVVHLNKIHQFMKFKLKILLLHYLNKLKQLVHFKRKRI